MVALQDVNNALNIYLIEKKTYTTSLGMTQHGFSLSILY